MNTGGTTVFTQSQLAIVVPKGNSAKVHGTADLAKAGLKLVLTQATTPVGKFARQSICTMGADPATYGAGFVAKVGANVVSEEADVKAVLAKVQGGQADAGIVYTSDATADVTVIKIPVKVNVIAKFRITAVKGGQTELAQAFIAYVLGPDGQATLHTFGFAPKP